MHLLIQNKCDATLLILSMAAHHFLNRTVLLVSMHRKEQAIAPLLREAFNMQVRVTEGIDTDEMGTFSGEIQRAGTQWEAAEAKLKKGKEKYPDADLLLASEGAFYPHPDSPFITLNHELLLLHDFKRNWRISGTHLSMKNNAASINTANPEEILSFAMQAGFPDTGIILKTADRYQIRKKPGTINELIEAAESLLKISAGSSILAETDLRAHRNPLRMENIGLAAKNLVGNMLSDCPQCHAPGYMPDAQVPGLPCEACGMPTRLPKAEVWLCRHCASKEEKERADGVKFSDPGYCDYCNP